MTPGGFALGALSVIDRKLRLPRPRSRGARDGTGQEDALRALARQVVTQLELRRNPIEMARPLAERTRAAGRGPPAESGVSAGRRALAWLRRHGSQLWSL